MKQQKNKKVTHIEIETVTYIEYLLTNEVQFTHVETNIRRIKCRDPNNASHANKYTGFRFFDRTECVINDELLIGERTNYSPIYYFGLEMSISDVKRKIETKPANRSNLEKVLHEMKLHNYKRVAATVDGRYYPLQKKDVVLERNI